MIGTAARIGAILAMAGIGIGLFYMLYRMSCTYGL